MSHEYYLVTLNAPPGLEDALVDCLLTFENAHGFSSMSVNSRDCRNQNLSLAEQVSGRQRKIRFQMYVDKDNIAEFLARIKDEFSGAGLQYWVVPIIAYGEI